MSSKKQPEPKPKATRKPPPSTLSVTGTEPAVDLQPTPAAIVQRAKHAPRAISPRDMLRLQRTVGNTAVSQLLRANPPRSHSTIVQTEATAKEKSDTVKAMGGLDMGTPDYASPALKNTPADEYKVTVAVSKEDLDWDSKFQKLLAHYAAYPLMRAAQISKKVRAWYDTRLNYLKDKIRDVGHAWVRLSSYVKGEVKELYSYGFYPQQIFNAESGQFAGGYLGFTKPGPGQVRHPDIAHENDPGKRYYDHVTTQSKYNEAILKAHELYQNPPQYVLMDYNCTTFAREILIAAGGKFPGKGVLPGHVYTPGYLYAALTRKKSAYGYGTKEKKDKEKEDPLADIVKQVTKGVADRGTENRERMVKEIADWNTKKPYVPALIEAGFISEEEARRLPVDDVRLFFAFKTFKNQGAELLGEKKNAADHAVIFQKVQKAFQNATREITDMVLGSAPPPITMSLMGQLSKDGFATLAKFLNISEKQLMQLRDNLGVTRSLKGVSGAMGHKEKTELGQKLKLSEDVLPQLTYNDVVAYSRFRRLFKNVDRKNLTEDIFIKAHHEANLGQFMGYLSKITEAGLTQLAEFLTWDKNDLEYLLYKVKAKFKVTPSQQYYIAGTEQNKVTVYAEQDFKRVGTVAGSTKVTALDLNFTEEDFVRIRYTLTQDGPEKAGRVLGVYLVEKSQPPKRNALAAIRSRVLRRRPPPKKPPKKVSKEQPSTTSLPTLDPIMGHRELVSKAGLGPKEPDVYQDILRYAEAWPVWKQAGSGDRWLYKNLTDFRQLIMTWQQNHQASSTKPRIAAITDLGAQIDRTMQMLLPRVLTKQLIPAAQLEKHDPLHREASILNYCKNRWLKTTAGQGWDPQTQPPSPQFFAFVTDLEKKNDPGLEDVVKTYLQKHLWSKDEQAEEKAARWVEMKKAKNQPLIPRIKYLQRSDREQYRLKFNGINMAYEKGGAIGAGVIYVMTPAMEFYGKPENKMTQMEFHHSSFLAGAEVSAAGQLSSSGSNLSVDLESGHYHPTTQHMVNALYGLQRKGVPLDKVKAYPIVNSKKFATGDAFLALGRAVKAITETVLEDLPYADEKFVQKILSPFGLISPARYLMPFLDELKEFGLKMLKTLKL